MRDDSLIGTLAQSFLALKIFRRKPTVSYVNSTPQCLVYEYAFYDSLAGFSIDNGKRDRHSPVHHSSIGESSSLLACRRTQRGLERVSSRYQWCALTMNMMMVATITTARMTEALSLALTIFMTKDTWNRTRKTPMIVIRANSTYSTCLSLSLLRPAGRTCSTVFTIHCKRATPSELMFEYDYSQLQCTGATPCINQSLIRSELLSPMET